MIIYIIMNKETLLKYISDNLSTREIAKYEGVTQSKVKYWIKKYEIKTKYSAFGKGISPKREKQEFNIEDIAIKKDRVYNYLYGLYLGDGCLYKRKDRNVSTITFSLDKKYPNIIKQCESYLHDLFGKFPYIYHRKNSNSVDVKYTSIIVDKLFLKYGSGKKHMNGIYLPKILVDNIHYDCLLKGLFHSDGSYYFNNRSGTYCYSFTNKSIDILNIFSRCLNFYDVKHSLSKDHIMIQSNKEVKKLYKILEQKN